MDISILSQDLEEVKKLEPAKTETRGRHKLGCSCEKCTKKREIKELEKNSKSSNDYQSFDDSNIFDDSLDFDNLMNEFDQTLPETENDNSGDTAHKFEQKESVKTASISGMMLLTVIDLAAPVIMIKIFSMFDAKYKNVDANDIRLDKSEKEDLREMADLIAKEYVNMNPLTLFAVSIGATYSLKIKSSV